MQSSFFVRVFKKIQATGARFAGFLRKKITVLQHGKKIFVVYTMGKVGTSTVSAFFRRDHPELISFHLHYLSDNWIKGILPKLNTIFHAQIKDAEHALARMKELPDHRLKIITMVREPLEREISIIFQNGKGTYAVDSITNLPDEFLMRDLDQNPHENALTWFDTEFKAFLEFDIYSVPFDKEKGYTIYHTPRADILCMKMEKMNDCIREAMKEFTGLRMPVPKVVNRSEEKEGKELYLRLKKSYKAPVEKLDLLYNSKFVNHFYTENEINEFVRRWSRGEMTYGDVAAVKQKSQ